MDEVELVAAAKAGDDDAFAALWRKHLPMVKAVARKMLREDIDDVCQEALVLAWSGLKKFNGDSPLATWLTRITMNRCLREINNRARRKLKFVSIDAQHPEAADDDEPVEDPDAFAVDHTRSISAPVDLAKLMRLLTPAQRRIVRLAYLDGASGDEVAKRLRITHTTARKQLFDAKQKMRAALDLAVEEHGFVRKAQKKRIPPEKPT